MFIRILWALLTAVFLGGAEFVFIVLLEHLTGFNILDCFNSDAWKYRTIPTIIKAVLFLFCVLFLVAAVVAVFMGENPLGESSYIPEQWEPAW